MRLLLTIAQYGAGDTWTDVLPLNYNGSKEEAIIELEGHITQYKIEYDAYCLRIRKWRKSCPIDSRTAQTILAAVKTNYELVVATNIQEWIDKQPTNEECPSHILYFGGEQLSLLNLEIGDITIQTVDEFFSCVE
jgi:NAD(P)H-nitrite reductase large subunit